MEGIDFAWLRDVLVSWLWEQFVVIVIIFIIVQIVIFFYALSNLSAKEAWHTHTNTWSSILTVIGVFGIFSGIFLGLLDFETGESLGPNVDKLTVLNNSIDKLLKGLRTAFVTSLVGIFTAICLKLKGLHQTQTGKDPRENDFVTALANTPRNVETPGEINLRAELVKLNKTVKEGSRETHETLGKIKTGLTGDGQNTLLTHLRNLSRVFSAERLSKIETALSDQKINLLEELQQLTKVVSRNHNQLIKSHEVEGRRIRNTLDIIKTDLVDKHDQLRDEFQKFSVNVAESVAKLATDELVNALKTVIEEFNAKIPEQFGENFKQLDQAVGKTVEWQEQYRQHMDELRDKLASEFQVAAESIENSRQSVDAIAQASHTIASRSDSIISCAEELVPVLQTLNGQLEAFNELRRRAHEAFPIIEKRLDDLTTNFSGTVKKAIDDSNTSIEKQRAALEEQVDKVQNTMNNTTQQLTTATNQFSENVSASINKSHDSMEKQRKALIDQCTEIETTMNTANQHVIGIVDGINDQLESVFEKSTGQITQLTANFTDNLAQQLRKTLNDFTEDISGKVDEAITDSQASVDKQRGALDNQTKELDEALRGSARLISQHVNQLDRQLREQLDASLNSLADQLTSLSGKFVEDYTPLTTALQRLVDMANIIEDELTGRQA